MKNKICTFLFAIIASIGTSSAEIIEKVKISDLYYNLDTEIKTAEVTYSNDYNDKYSGDITIPSSVIYETETYAVTSIGSSAFSGCSSVNTVIIPNSVTSIGRAAFASCTSLTSIDIPNSVISLGDCAFEDCSSLVSVTIPNSVTSIDYQAFNKCVSLTSISVATDNPNYCSLDGVLFNEDKTAIIQYPSGKPGTSYTIPNSVKSIERAAFGFSKYLTSVEIPNSVTNIGYGAFVQCESLTTIEIPNSVTSIGRSAFNFCFSLTSVIIPNSVTSIEEWAFYYCKSLTSIELPNSLTSIENCAFSHCSGLVSVEIPNSITNLGGGAFEYCTALKSITCKAVELPTLGMNVFYDVDKSIPLYVPAESVEAYQAADQWKDFNVQAIPANYNIRYVDKNAELISSEQLTFHVPTAPEFAGFTFLKWVVVAGDLEDGITIQAVYTANTPTSAPEMYTNPSNPAQKLIREGNVYILTGGNTYTIHGQKVR